MIAVMPINLKTFRKENLKLIKEIYKRTNLKLIFSGVLDYENIFKSFDNDDEEFIRANSIIIKNDYFSFSECLQKFVKYNEHIVDDEEKVIILKDDIVISIIKSFNDINTLKDNEILLIKICEEKNKTGEFSYENFSRNKNILQSIFFKAISKNKKNELTIKSVVPVFNFKHLKTIQKNFPVALSSEKTICEYLINNLSLKFKKDEYFGIKLDPYYNNINNNTTNDTSTQPIIDRKSNLKFSNTTNSQYKKTLIISINNTKEFPQWENLLNLLDKTDKFNILINTQDKTIINKYKDSCGRGTWRNIFPYNIKENKKKIDLNVYFYIPNDNITQDYSIYFLTNNSDFIKNFSVYKKVFYKQDEYNQIKLFQSNNFQSIFISPFIKSRSDNFIIIYNNIKRILQLK